MGELSPNPTTVAARLRQTGKWTKYEDGLCQSCLALCCYLAVEAKLDDLIRLGILTEFHRELSEREQVKDALKHRAVQRYHGKTSKYTISQKSDGSCYFLDQQQRCSRYEDRPNTCREHPAVGPRPGYCPYLRRPKLEGAIKTVRNP